MSEQPITYESIMAMIREQSREHSRALKKSRAEFERRNAEFERSIKESQAVFDQRMQESQAAFERQSAETNKKIAQLGDRIGEIVENMVAGNIVDKFKALGYDVDNSSSRYKFGNAETGRGEIDLYLEDGIIAILIEVKTHLTVQDIQEHIERLEKFRRAADRKGDKRHFIGAVVGAVVNEDAANYAHKKGMYVIVQSGEAVEILPVPVNFKAKEW